MRIFIQVIVLFIIPFSLLSKINYKGSEEVSFLSAFETKNCFITYVMINGYTYIIKQKKDFKKQLAVVRDTLAAYIAKDLAVAHEVDIIDFKKNIVGKHHLKWPATIHTIAAGETVRKQKTSKYNAIRLKQHWSRPDINNEIGLTKMVINYMTWHKQLPVIVALDLFIGNSDRHIGNLCYDPETDKFCAIDMDDTFNKDLCELACRNFDKMIKNKTAQFTKEEIKALIIMRNTLKLLVQKHTPRDLIVKMYTFGHRAGFVKGSPLYNERIQRRFAAYERNIQKTYESARHLIVILDKIIRRKAMEIV